MPKKVKVKKPAMTKIPIKLTAEQVSLVKRVATLEGKTFEETLATLVNTILETLPDRLRK